MEYTKHIGISKSRYTLYRQCPKALWLRTYKPELCVISDALQQRFHLGSAVGDLAKGLFGKFVDVTSYSDNGYIGNNDGYGYGNYVIICHPAQSGWKGLLTYYAHLKSPSPLPAGTPVKQGEEIGKMGDTGLADGSHLHFEVRTSPGTYNCRVNPLSYLP